MIFTVRTTCHAFTKGLGGCCALHHPLEVFPGELNHILGVVGDDLSCEFLKDEGKLGMHCDLLSGENSLLSNVCHIAADALILKFNYYIIIKLGKAI